MTWTYSGDPTVSQTDELRFLIGDTVEKEPFLENEELDYLINKWLAVQGTMFWVASVACEQIAAKLAREASHSADGVSVALGELQSKFMAQADALRDQHNRILVGGIPEGGGINRNEGQDPTIAPMIFGTGMHDDLEAGRQDYGSRSMPEYWPPEEYPGQ